MKLTKEHPIYKTVCLTQGDLSGKFTLSFDGVELKKTGKVTFEYIDPESGAPINVTVSGNVFKGFCLVVKSEIIQMSPAAKWYDIVFGVIPAMIFFIFIQGAIGGAIAGGLGMLSTFVSISCKTMRKKILVCLGICAISTVSALVLSVLIAMLYQSLGLV